MSKLQGIFGCFCIIHAIGLGIKSESQIGRNVEHYVLWAFIWFLIGMAVLIYHFRNGTPRA